MILAQLLGQPLGVIRAVLVLSGFLPCACGYVGVFQAVCVPPFTIVVCRVEIFRSITTLQLWAVIPIAWWDLAVAVWPIEAPGSSTLALGDLGPLGNPSTQMKLQFWVEDLPSDEVHLAIFEPVHSARRAVFMSVSLSEKTALSWAVNLNALRLIEFRCSLESLQDS